MVWFQCEDCGDNLKKPKLHSHFRQCSAYKLSCIDCGEVFGQQTVESHTQCITEAEKYGPKGQTKASNGTNTKPKNDTKQKPEVDINVGLSNRPPWFCSLCNTKTTSKQTLLLHAEGKKHRAKARGFHAANNPPTDAVETKILTENNAKNEISEINGSEESKEQNSSKVNPLKDGSGVENDALKSDKKRKLEASQNGAKLGDDAAIQIKVAEEEVTKGLKKAKYSTPDVENGKTKIKWKKLIISALKSSPDGGMKLKKLQKFVLKSLKESGFTEDKNQASQILEQKINSSSKFTLDGKYVRLATSS